ncbi:MAG: hypothetical protein CFH01_01226 [Alphaproteobacteria bacterium MarineAlpha2_Bin1]|nr:MAG: hypothetical protein CFH01_01226 [Alphaproteobacteria bacterium MarineAlpha2_Bin1]
MFSKKILASVSAIALLLLVSGVPAVVSAADADTVLNKGQIFKTGKGMAAGQAAAAGAGGAGSGITGALGTLGAGSVAAGVAVAAAIGVAVAAVVDDSSTTTATSTTVTCRQCISGILELGAETGFADFATRLISPNSE